MAWLLGRKGARGEKPRRGPSTEELTETLHSVFVRVGAAAERCETAHGNELAVRKRELAGELRGSMTELRALVGGTALSPRNVRMARLATEEVWTIAQPWLILDFLAADRPAVTAKMSELERRTWHRTEETVATAQGEEPVVGRARLHQLTDEIDAFVVSLVTMAVSERHATLWQLVAEDVTRFVSDALAGLPDGET